MPHSISTVRSLSRELEDQFDVRPGEDADVAMRRIDDSAARAVCRHLLSGLTDPGRSHLGLSHAGLSHTGNDAVDGAA